MAAVAAAINPIFFSGGMFGLGSYTSLSILGTIPQFGLRGHVLDMRSLFLLCVQKLSIKWPILFSIEVGNGSQPLGHPSKSYPINKPSILENPFPSQISTTSSSSMFYFCIENRNLHQGDNLEKS
jgi:hypothetical protein